MNIFVLDTSQDLSAQYHVDRHIVKMPLETAQILCTVVNETGGKAPYRSTHKSHPCTIWAGKSLSNWIWLRDFGLALGDEYQYRYGRTHKSVGVIQGLAEPSIPDMGLTPFALAMPDKYKDADAIASYRAYYVGEKHHLAQWTKRSRPMWF